jgi:outer membrane protein insertion porin family
MRLFRKFAAALILLASLPVAAQYTVGSVAYVGGAPYTDTELSSVAGLQAGQAIATNALGSAAQHILDTGLFDDVQATYTAQGKALHITFHVKPTPLAKLPAVSLENFVWFTPEELAAGLHQQLPLYRGVSSDAGTFSDSIQDALQKMLTAKGVQATLSHTTVEPTSQHPVRVVDYKVERPALRIVSLNLTVDATAPDVVAATTVKLPTRSPVFYNEGLTGLTVEDFLLLAAHNNGYITAKVLSMHRELATTATGTGVAVTATIQPGEPYKIASFHWTETPVYDSATFARDAKLKPGDTAQFYKLRDTEAAIVSAYHGQGYLDAYIDPDPKMDATAHTVSYNLRAVPGEQYKFKSVTALGLDPAGLSEFNQVWKIKPGDVFNETYVQTFITGNKGLQGLAKYAGSYQIAADPTTHLVDLTMQFNPNPSH